MHALQSALLDRINHQHSTLGPSDKEHTRTHHQEQHLEAALFLPHLTRAISTMSKNISKCSRVWSRVGGAFTEEDELKSEVAVARERCEAEAMERKDLPPESLSLSLLLVSWKGICLQLCASQED